MLPQTKSEENLPLLLLFLDEGSKPPPKSRNFFLDRNRYNRISEGASNVLTQWPGHVSTCWISSFIVLLLFFFLLLVLLAASMNPNHIHPRCIPYEMNYNNSKIYLVHRGKWQVQQFEAIEDIANNYPDFDIELILLRNASINNTLNRRKRQIKLDINVGKEMLEKGFGDKQVQIVNLTAKNLPLVASLSGLLMKFPRVTVRNETMEDFFSFTPLQSHWKRLDADILEFGARVLMLWEFAGISFKLPDSNTTISDNFTDNLDKPKPKYKIPNYVTFPHYDVFIESNWQGFKLLPTGVVNIDEDGWHMETKTPCHAYFGEVLANLRKADRNVTVGVIVKKTLETFCKNGAVDDDFCDNISKS